ncbi:class I SAM-dependent methyltransferase [Burkholderia sp. BCC1977]|uniref:class I SAM-dependent methyltransferase n=1 Tax=Burkholderia sp. BCC1977 TaxID=2817440 RepID=UPI002ABE1C2C|nr:methyltransferase domain-containing protein [Burkholderia sp. BCC1977]
MEEAFSAFERQGWEKLAGSYHSYYADLTDQSIDALLVALDLQPGIALLDVATGPGYLAAAAAARGADVVGVDFATAMVEQARKLNPALAFRVGNAEALPFTDQSFDAVGSNFGWHHFPHPDKALSEAFRVLRPGGRIAFTVWASQDKCAGIDIVLKAIAAHGNPDVELPAAPPFFRFSDRDECERALLEAGFADPEVLDVDQTWHIRAPETPFHALMRGGVRVAAILKAQTPHALAAIEEAVSKSVTKYLVDGDVLVPMPAVLASARKV